jgi:hypothetical protein
MTRETKVGLVVAASFLCLVGVVVASRLGRNPDTKQAEPVAQAIASNQEPAPKKETEPAKGQDAHANPKENKSPPPDVVPAGLNTATTAKEGEPNKLPTWPSIPQAPLPPLDTSAAAPHVDPSAKAKVAEDASDKAHKDTVDILIQQKAKEDAAKAATGATLDKTVGGLPKAVPIAELAALPTAPVVAGPVAPLGKDDGFFAPAVPQHSDPVPAVDHKKGLDNPPPTPPPAAPKIEDAAKGHIVAPPPIVPLAGVGAAVSPPSPTANPPKASQEIASPPIVPPTDPKLKAAEPAPVAGIDPPPPTQLAFNQQPPNPLKSTLDAGMKPVPQVAVASVPAKAPSGPSPQVKKTDMDIYSCKADDTFETVSTRFFGTPKYARALLQFNRDYPMANKGTNLQDANPKLQPGQQVLVPPQDFLDARFASLIDNRPAVAPSAPAVSINAPVSAGAVSPPPGTPTVATSDATKPYRVPDPGQMLIEIAQQKLGDRGRWSEIYRLNPTLRPEFPIPAGTEIRLPGNANTP